LISNIQQLGIITWPVLSIDNMMCDDAINGIDSVSNLIDFSGCSVFGEEATSRGSD
jgi:hypothetical protein